MEWIKVTDKKPSLRKKVLVYNTEGATLIGERYTNGWVACFSDGEQFMGILAPTHWMPLPKPPQN